MNKRGMNMPFGMPVQGYEGNGYWPGTPGYGGMGGGFLAPLLRQWLGQSQPQAAAPKPVTIDKMPKDIRALTSMSSGRTMDSDGFLGGIFGPGGKAK